MDASTNRKSTPPQHRLCACFAILACWFAGIPGLVKAEPVRLPPLQADATILAFGDSLTSGVGGSGQNYPQLLAQRIHREVVGDGPPGETTAEARRHLPAALRSDRPDLMILCLGINDFFQNLPPEQTRDNLLAMLATARAAGVPVLLIAVPRPGAAIADPMFDEVAAKAGVAVDDRSMVEVLSNPGLKFGLVHPNSDGYRQFADSLANRLRLIGALPGAK